MKRSISLTLLAALVFSEQGFAQYPAAALRDTTLPPIPGLARWQLGTSPRHGEWVSISAGAGDRLRAWVVYPERRDRAPVVVVVHELFGLTTWVRGVADKLAAEGFIAIAPDLFSGLRLPMPPDSMESDPAALDSVRALAPRLDYGRIVRRLEATGRFGTSLPAALPIWGVTGFCWGGSMAFVAAAYTSTSAVVAWYGEATARIQFDSAKAPTLGIFAEHDARVNTTIPYIDSSYRRIGVRFERRVFEGAGHAFLRELDGHGGANHRAGRSAWPWAMDWLRTHLRERPREPMPSGNILRLEAREYSLGGDTTAIAGQLTVRLVNRGREPHYARLFRLAPGKTLTDFNEWRASRTPAPEWLTPGGGLAPVMPGDSADYVNRIEPGRYVVLCSYPTEAGMPHVELGMIRMIDIRPGDAPAPVVQGTQTSIRLENHRFVTSGVMIRGVNTVEVENSTADLHQVLLIERPNESVAEREMQWFRAGTRGPRPGLPRGGIIALEPRGRASFVVDLKPGLYLLLCSVVDREGKRHFDHGMWASFTVTDSTWRDHDRAAAEARRRGDWRSALEHARAIDSLTGHPRAVLSMARMNAKLGDTTAARHALARVAAMGLHHRIAADTDLMSLAKDFAQLQTRFDSNVLATGNVVYDATIRDRDFIAEGIALDTKRRRLLVSSIRHNIVAELAPNDNVHTAIDLTNDGAWSGLALAVDSMRNALWMTSKHYARSIHHAPRDSGRSTVLLYDLDSRKPRGRWELPLGGEPGDICLAANGTLYVSDGRKGVMYAVSTRMDSIRTLTRAGELFSPQGCAVDPRDDHLFVADYVLGIARVKLADGAVEWLRRPPNSALNGIDGMVLHGTELIGVQNGVTPNRLIVAELDPAHSIISRVRVIAQDTTRIREPTHLTVVGDTVFFVANGGFGAYEEDGKLRAGAIERPPLIGRIALRGSYNRRTLDTAATKAALLAADSALAEDVARRGSRAVLDVAAPEAAILIPHQPITAAKSAAGIMAHRYGGRTYSHSPAHAILSADGKLGCTLGVSRYAPDSGKGTRAGHYVTCWRRASGRWEIVAHLRNESEAATAVNLRWRGPVPRSPASYRAVMPNESAGEARAADSAFARLGSTTEGPGPAFEAFIADDGLLVMSADKIFQGPKGMRVAFDGFPPDRVLLWDPHPDYGWGSGGLAVTVGHSVNSARRPGAGPDRPSKYLTIWRQDPDGRWRFIYDAGNSRP